MDKLGLLKARQERLTESSAEIRKKIAEIVDKDSFVESDSFAFSKNEFYGEDMSGLGVVTGFATVNDYPFYIVAINPQVLSGGLTAAGCKKIVKCLDKALAVAAPVMYVLSSKGVVAGEGVTVLESIGEVLSKMQDLKGSVPQFAVCMGDVLGQASLFVASADYAYYFKDTCVAYGSPLVIAAKSGKSVDKAAIGGYASAKFNNLATFEVADLAEVKESVTAILDVLPASSGAVVDFEDDANRPCAALNAKVDAKTLVEATFDEGSFIELNSQYAPEVKVGIGRIGGVSCAAILFDKEGGVELDPTNLDKVTDFLYYCEDNDLPLITFVNTLGLKNDLQTANSSVLKQMTYLVYALKTNVPRINVICGKAVGLGYTLFASKSFGADYSYAFATAQISLFDSNVGAELEVVAKGGDYEEIKSRYEEYEMDAFNAAKDGLVDNVIEPEFVRQYVISALQMLV